MDEDAIKQEDCNVVVTENEINEAEPPFCPTASRTAMSPRPLDSERAHDRDSTEQEPSQQSTLARQFWQTYWSQQAQKCKKNPRTRKARKAGKGPKGRQTHSQNHAQQAQVKNVPPAQPAGQYHVTQWSQQAFHQQDTCGKEMHAIPQGPRIDSALSTRPCSASAQASSVAGGPPPSTVPNMPYTDSAAPFLQQPLLSTVSSAKNVVWSPIASALLKASSVATFCTSTPIMQPSVYHRTPGQLPTTRPSFPQELCQSTPGGKMDPEFSLFKNITSSPFQNGLSLSSLGRPWQMERFKYTKNPTTSQMLNVHLWPPQGLLPHMSQTVMDCNTPLKQGSAEPPELMQLRTPSLRKTLSYCPKRKLTHVRNELKDSNLKSYRKRDSVSSDHGHYKDYSVKFLKRLSSFGDATRDRQGTATRSSVGGAGYGHNSGSDDSVYLDDGCEEFDEDLEPLDLSVRASATKQRSQIVGTFGDDTKSRPPSCPSAGRSSLGQGIAGLDDEGFEEGHRSDWHSQASSTDVTPRPQLEITKDSMLQETPGSEDVDSIKDNMLPIKKRRFSNGPDGMSATRLGQETLSAEHGRQWPSGRDQVRSGLGKVVGGAVRICRQCHCDYRATLFTICPLCSSAPLLASSAPATNSVLSSVASLPPQVCIGRRCERLCVFANRVLEPLTLLGTLLGRLVDAESVTPDCDVTQLWVLETTAKGIPHRVLDMRDETAVNWLRYVQFGTRSGLHNVSVIHQGGRAMLVTTQRIEVGWQLLLRPYNPLLSHVNTEQRLRCTHCTNTYTLPVLLANHIALQHVDLIPSLEQTAPSPDPGALAGVDLSSKRQKPLTKGETPGAKPNHQQMVSEEKSPATQPEGKPPEALSSWFCGICKSFFKSKAGHRAHMSIVHKKAFKKPEEAAPIFTCGECQVSFRSSWGLQQHERIHTMEAAGAEVLNCPHCGKKFWRKQSYRRHVMAHETNTGFQSSPTCEHCGRKFYSSSNLKVHMLTHSGVKPFNCQVPDCLTGFTTKQSLQFHYIKRHGFCYDSMPVIQRNVPFTFEDYGGQRPDDVVKQEGDQEDEEEDMEQEERCGEGGADDGELTQMSEPGVNETDGLSIGGAPNKNSVETAGAEAQVKKVGLESEPSPRRPTLTPHYLDGTFPGSTNELDEKKRDGPNLKVTTTRTSSPPSTRPGLIQSSKQTELCTISSAHKDSMLPSLPTPGCSMSPQVEEDRLRAREIESEDSNK